MTTSSRTSGGIRTIALAATAGALFALACTSSLPTSQDNAAQAKKLELPLVATRKPLMLVDGRVATEEAVREIAPDEIASIEIIKGPNAVTRFGKDAQQGAIMVQLKKAQLLEATKPAGPNRYGAAARAPSAQRSQTP